MNERIKELVVESGNGLMRDGKLYPHIGIRFEEDWQRFAELIVKECAKECDLLLNHKMSSEWARGTHDCSKAIKQHFGVEE